MSAQPAAPGQQKPVPFADAVERAVLSVSRHWLAGLIGYGALATVLPVLAPLMKSRGLTMLSSPIYFAYAFICHQNADRSLHLHGEQMAFCARDLAIFGGALGIALIYATAKRVIDILPSGSWMIVAATLPITVDGVTQLLGLRDSTIELRILTGVLFSAGIGWYLLPRLQSAFGTVSADILEWRAAGRDDAHTGSNWTESQRR